MGRTAADAHRGRAAGEGEQVHHAARAALGAAGNPPAAARQRVAHHHSARGPPGPCGRARGVPRERVLGNPREPKEGRSQCDAGAPRREDAGVTMRIVYWQELDTVQRRAALARPAFAARADIAADVSRLIAQVRAEGDAALLALTEHFDGVRLDSLAVSAAEFAAARARLTPV